MKAKHNISEPAGSALPACGEPVRVVARQASRVLCDEESGAGWKPAPLRSERDFTVRKRSTAMMITVVFGAIILIPSLIGFVMKFGEMIALTDVVSDGGFAVTPVINYLLASAGFFFLLLWAACNGMFRDLEQPKYIMLENERELDRHE